jgi:hypothetical protein
MKHAWHMNLLHICLLKLRGFVLSTFARMRSAESSISKCDTRAMLWSNSMGAPCSGTPRSQMRQSNTCTISTSVPMMR